ncbi:MAG TPA: hypothetical protein VJZ27_09085, partial [Aggregatilineales bacterium]|nr:hypothetical protein [Aggregatilineales bacterium]
ELILGAAPLPAWTHGVERFDLARDAVRNVTGFDLPPVLQLALFLFIYIFLMGPVNYLLLRMLGRREFAWFTIPVFILVFTIFAYYTGFSIRGNDVTVNQVSVVQVWDGVDRARVDGVLGILSPRRTTYDVLLHDDLNLRTIPNVGGTSSIAEMNITQGESYSADDIPVDAAIMTNFATSGYIPAPEISGQATWTLRGGLVSPRVNGEVTNGLPTGLLDVVILANDQFYEMGDLAAGETQTFQMIVPLDRHVRSPLGNRVDPGRPVIYPGLPRGQTLSGVCLMSPGPNVVYESLMAGQDFRCSGDGDDELKLRRRALIVAAMSNEIDRNGGRGSGVYMFGWSDAPPLDIEIPEYGQITDGTVLYIYEIPSTIRATTPENITVPPGFLSWTLIEQDQPNRLPDINADLSFQITGNQGVALRFTPLPTVPLREVEEAELFIDWRLGGARQIGLSFWNWDTQAWDLREITSDEQTRFIIEVSEYIGPLNSVQVLVSSEDIASFQIINSMTLTMRGSGS